MSEEEEDLDRFCSQLVEAYLSLSEEDGGGIEERGGGGNGKEKKDDTAADHHPDSSHQQLAQTLLQYQPTQTAAVPQQLPEALRNSPEDIQPDQLLVLYDLDSSMEQVEAGTLSTLDLIALHLRSYRNIMEIQLSDMSQLRQRFLGFFTSIFTQVMDRCYQGRTDTIALQMWDELRRNQDRRRQPPSSRT